MRHSFHYIFNDNSENEAATPRLTCHVFDETPLSLFGLDIQPLRLAHGYGTGYGFRFGRAAYLTDHSDIPQRTMDQLQGVDVPFLDALRHRPHPTHSTVERSLRSVELLERRPAF